MGRVVRQPQFSRAFSFRSSAALASCTRHVPLVSVVIGDGPSSGHTRPLHPDKRVHLPARAVPPCVVAFTEVNNAIF